MRQEAYCRNICDTFGAGICVCVCGKSMKQKTGEAGEREKGKGRQERGRGCFHTIDLSRKHDSVIPHTDGYTPHSSSCYSFAATSCLQPGLHRRV